MRLRRSLDKLYEAGCNLTRKMCIKIYCAQNKKVKVRHQTRFLSGHQFEGNSFLR